MIQGYKNHLLLYEQSDEHSLLLILQLIQSHKKDNGKYESFFGGDILYINKIIVFIICIMNLYL